MVRYIIQKDGSGNDSPISFDSCSGDGSSDREYLGRDGVHVLRNATSYALADFALRYGFVSLHLAEALVQHINKGRIEIHPAEASVVKWVFDSYIAGYGTAEIARTLRENNVPTYFGGVWRPMRIVELLRNEKYAGNALLQKEFTIDHLTKARARNRGELPMYFAEGSHPAIVSVETFDAAQQRLERNRLASCAACDTTATHPFTGMIVCDKCGKKYKRVTKNGRYSWNCSTYQTFGKAYCHTKKIPEDILMENTAAAMGMADFDENTFLEKVQEIHVPAFNHLVFCFKDGTKEDRVWQDRSRRDSWTPEMKQQAAQQARRRCANV